MLRLPTVNFAAPPIDWKDLPRTFTNEGEMETIINLLNSIGAKRMAEFGCNNGRTARLILDNVPTMEKYFGFDITPDWVPECKVQRNEVPRNPGQYANGDERFGLSVTSRGTYDIPYTILRGLDAVFIDGDHSRAAVLHDSALAAHFVRPGGIILWHDYHDMGNVDVRDVLHDLFDDGLQIKHVEGTWLAVLQV